MSDSSYRMAKAAGAFGVADENATLRERVQSLDEQLGMAAALIVREKDRADAAEAGLSKQEAELFALRANLAEANERLRLCEVPDGWEAWRLKMEAKLEGLRVAYETSHASRLHADARVLELEAELAAARERSRRLREAHDKHCGMECCDLRDEPEEKP